MSSRLDQQQVEHYRQQGYLLYHDQVFSPDKFQGLKEHFEHQLREWTAVEGRRPEAMDCPHYEDGKLLDWLLADEVLDLIEPLIGPDIALFASHFICKPAGDGRRVPWHEDSAYWGTLFQPMDVVTLWLAIDPADEENGCMRVIPGTQHNGYSQYHQVEGPSVFGTEIDQGLIDERQAVNCTLDENQCSFHHAKLVHGSNANVSQRRRCGYTMRYVPTTCRLDNSDYGRQIKLFLARGRDRAGNRYADPKTLAVV